jgi:hypothetical protein
MRWTDVRLDFKIPEDAASTAVTYPRLSELSKRKVMTYVDCDLSESSWMN